MTNIWTSNSNKLAVCAEQSLKERLDICNNSQTQNTVYWYEIKKFKASTSLSGIKNIVVIHLDRFAICDNNKFVKREVNRTSN